MMEDTNEQAPSDKLDGLIQAELGKVAGELSKKILDVTFESQLPTVVQFTALESAAAGFAKTWIGNEPDPDKRTLLATLLAKGMMKMVDEILEAGAPEDDEEEDRTR